MVKIFESKYYGLKEVKQFNDLIDTIEKESNWKSNDTIKTVENIIKWCNLYEGSDRNDYVPGSQKYKDVVQRKRNWKKGQNRLKKLNHIREKVIDDHYCITIIRHTFQTEVQEYDYDSQESYTTVSHFTFFTTSRTYKDEKLIVDFQELKMGYVLYPNHRWDRKDLIDDALQTIERLQKDVQIYRFSQEWGHTYHEITELFGRNPIFWGSLDANEISATKESKRYYKGAIKKLLEEYKAAKEMRYVVEDEIVKYRAYCYMDHLDSLKEGKIRVYEEAIQ